MGFPKRLLAHIFPGLPGPDPSLCEPLVFCAWAFSWKLNERSPRISWIPGTCEVGLGIFFSPPCKTFLARKGVLNFLCSDPGILKLTERFTGWKQKSSACSLHSASDTLLAAGSWRPRTRSGGGWWQGRIASAWKPQKNLNLSAGSHSAWMMKERNLEKAAVPLNSETHHRDSHLWASQLFLSFFFFSPRLSRHRGFPGDGKTQHYLTVDPGNTWEPVVRAFLLVSVEMAGRSDGPVSD